MSNILQTMPVTGKDRSTCPTCGMAVKIVRRADGMADHYEHAEYDEIDKFLEPQNEHTAKKLRKLRKGKKTVALVGMAATSCSLAPFDEEGVEIWGLNEMHAFEWMTRATRWFQMHTMKSWKRKLAKRKVSGHKEWLLKNEWDIPIYMQHWNDEVPNIREYPLSEIISLVFKNIRRGDAKIKYFTSSFAYYMGVALLEGRSIADKKAGVKPFERIEIYGFEMSAEVEYVQQKACAEFWIGVALGMGIEIYVPTNCQLVSSPLYGGDEQGEGW